MPAARMLPLAQQPLHQHGAARPHSFGQRGERLWIPACHLAVRRRHVRGNGCVALKGALDVTGDALARRNTSTVVRVMHTLTWVRACWHGTE